MNTFTTSNGGSYLLIKALKAKKRSAWPTVGRALLVAGLLAALLFPLTAKGEEIGTDKFAHMGFGYAAHTFAYGFCHKAFKMPKLQSHIFAFASVLLMGLTKEMMDRRPDGYDLLANHVGEFGAIITIDAFDF